jgi:hypothetical protein
MLEGPTIFRLDPGMSAGLGVPRLDLAYEGQIEPEPPPLFVPWEVFSEWRAEVVALRETVEVLRLRVEVLEQPWWWTRLWLWLTEVLLGR